MTDQTATAALTVDELRADFEHSKRLHLTRPRFSTEEIGTLFAEIDRLRALAAPAVPPDSLTRLQAGFNNAELLAHWRKKLPGVEPTDRELSAFAVGTEVGWQRARDVERQDWDRVHHALAKHGKHPGRTDDHLADVIDRALSAG